MTLKRQATRLVAEFDNGVEGQLAKLRGNPVADKVFYTASALGDHSLIWFVLGSARGLRDRHSVRAAVRVGIGLGIESGLVNLGVKSLFRRKRPVFEGERPLELRRPLTSSFPSGHATSGFMAATLLSEGDEKLAPLYFAIASVIALSRVYVKIHHASDVVAGAALGLGLGRMARRLAPLEAIEEIEVLKAP
ncbi:MAG TPA: phosphatase PAP2 family protein [Acidimicrobiales bacterium]|nr:phosphatase PAP2 family protein [Acidimicrobiales bacterium]